jgi:hypothetical protein
MTGQVPKRKAFPLQKLQVLNLICFIFGVQKFTNTQCSEIIVLFITFVNKSQL